jgi:hypothetical protein
VHESPAAPTATSPRSATPIASAGTQIEFATPPSVDNNLDADDDEGVEHRYRTLDGILGADAVPGLAHRGTEEAELHAVSVEEPRTLKEADGDPNWAAVMEEELKSIRDNNT